VAMAQCTVAMDRKSDVVSRIWRREEVELGNDDVMRREMSIVFFGRGRILVLPLPLPLPLPFLLSLVLLKWRAPLTSSIFMSELMDESKQRHTILHTFFVTSYVCSGRLLSACPVTLLSGC
jgi:hypothetical protein